MEETIDIPIDKIAVSGDLNVPELAKGIIIFIPGASHLFEEPGKLEEVASLTTEWFRRHLVTLIK